LSGGIIFLGIVLVVRSKITQSSTDNKAAVEAAVTFITDPMVTRFVVLIVLGVVTGAVGLVMNRKESPTVS
jgi:drug/metabolite transporter (DMT)-like permease